jgi:hypothetical protein
MGLRVRTVTPSAISFLNAIKHYRGIGHAYKKPRATSLPDCTLSAHSLGLK